MELERDDDLEKSHHALDPLHRRPAGPTEADMSYDIERLRRHRRSSTTRQDLAAAGSWQDLVRPPLIRCGRQVRHRPLFKEWQVRLARLQRPEGVAVPRGNEVVGHDQGMDLALIRVAGSEQVPCVRRCACASRASRATTCIRSRPAIARIEAARWAARAHPALAARGWTAGPTARPRVDACDLPNDPHAGWPGMSGSAVVLGGTRSRRDPGVWRGPGGAGEFRRKLMVARLAEA